MRQPLGRTRWVAASWTLRKVLSSYLEDDPASIEICSGIHGKPALAGSRPPLRFNLSHSGNLALIAVTGEREVGIDLEEIDPGRDLIRLAEVGLGADAAAAVRAAPPEARPAIFYRAWVCREAVAKCHGVGLAAPVPDATVSVSDLAAGTRYAAALAVAAEAPLPVKRFSY